MRSCVRDDVHVLAIAQGRTTIRWIAAFSVLFIAVISCISAVAQEAHWKDLNDQVEALYQQGKYAEALPIAQEAVRVAQSTFGPEDPNVAAASASRSLVHE